MKNLKISESSKCYFSTGIDESLTCCKNGDFDFYGFPNKMCELYPCKKYIELNNELIADKN